MNQELKEVIWYELASSMPAPSIAGVFDGDDLACRSLVAFRPRYDSFTEKAFWEYNATLLMLTLCFDYDEDLSTIEFEEC